MILKVTSLIFDSFLTMKEISKFQEHIKPIIKGKINQNCADFLIYPAK